MDKHRRYWRIIELMPLAQATTTGGKITDPRRFVSSTNRIRRTAYKFDFFKMNEPEIEPLCLMPSGLCHCVLGKSRIGTKHAGQNHRHHDHRRRLRTSVTASPGFSKKVGGSLRARGIGPSASATSIRPACRACGTVSWRFAGRRAHAGLPASFRRPPKTTPEGIVVYFAGPARLRRS